MSDKPYTASIPHLKVFTEERPCWWCDDCGTITEFEHNPDWIAAGRPMRITGRPGDPTYFPERWGWHRLPEGSGWIARCSVCKNPFFDVDECGCEECGWPGVQDYDPETDGVRYGPSHPLNGLSHSPGATWWTETVTCGGCGVEYTYDNQSE